jgi:hypothetical protein
MQPGVSPAIYFERDHSDTRQNAKDAHDRELAEVTREGGLVQEDAEETLDHALIDALKAYRQSSAETVRIAASGVADKQFDYQTGVAEVQHDFHVDVVVAAADHAVELARAEAIESYGVIAAGADFDLDDAEFARTLEIDNAESQKAYEVDEATTYLSDVTGWGAIVTVRWGAYQIDLAEAELARVTALGDARILRATGLGDATRQWTSTVTTADLEYGATLYGGAEGGGALVTRHQTIADAHVVNAERSSLVDYVTAQADAVRTHDQGVAEANRSLIHQVAELDATRDRELASSLHQFHRDVHQALYEVQREHGGSVYTHEYQAEIDKAAKAKTKRDAKANEAYAVGVAEARRDWTAEVGDLNVAFVEQLVNVQEDRAEALREDIITLATAVATAQETYVTTDASAIQRHVVKIAGADATSRTSKALVEAGYSLNVASALNDKSEGDAIALGVYEVGLFADHATATSTYHTSTGSALSLYQKLATAADLTWAVSKAIARNLYHQTLSGIETGQTMQRNAAYLGEAEASAAVYKAFATDQAAVDRTYAVEEAGADADLYVAKKTAEAELLVSTTASQGDADVAYAEAVRDRDNAYAKANVAWVKATQAAETSYIIGDIDDEARQERIAAANVARQKAKGDADKTFQRAINDAGAEETTELGTARLAYVDAVGLAKVDHANAVADAELAHANDSARSDNRLVAEIAKTTETHEILVRTADYYQVEDLADADVAYETELRNAGAILGYTRGLAEANLHLDRAEADAIYWGNAYAASLGDVTLRFRAAEAASREAWFAELTDDYAAFRAQVAYAEGQAAVDLAYVRAADEVERAAATLAYQSSVAGEERQRTIDRALAENAGYVENVRHEGGLTVDIATAEYDHANAYAKAVVHDEATLDSISRDDLTYEQRTEATEKAAHARTVAIARAERNWQLDVSAAEFAFASAESRTEHDLLDRLANIEWQFSVGVAEAEAIRDVDWAYAEQTKLVDETIAENVERESRALAAATLQTAKYDARSDAMGILVLAMPRAEGQIQGINVGFATSNLSFTANMYAGVSNPGEFRVTGSSLTRHASAGGQSASLGTLGDGVAVDDAATGSGYLMFSVADVHARFSGPNAPKAGSANQVIAVRYSGGQWQYNNDLGWFTFTLATGDLLLAEVNFDSDSVYGVGGYLPWAAYMSDRAVAEENAWAATVDDYLEWQQDISAVRTTFATQRAGEYAATAELASDASLAYDRSEL